MADVIPFRGWRYNPERGCEAGLVLAPPYDVISECERQAFIDKHPYNIVRLTLGVDPLGTPPTRSRYELAAADLREWRREGILVRDEKPAFYIYEQKYIAPAPVPRAEPNPVTRRGVVGLVRLAQYDEGVVLPHEGTLATPKVDRRHLVDAMQCSESQIFGMYSDPDMVVERIAEEVCRRPPLWDMTDRDGVEHRLWLVDDEGTCAELTDMFSSRPVVIADGHHRYETALAYREAQRQKHGSSAEAPWEYVSMFLCNTDAGQLTILPSHRLIKELPLEAEAQLWRSVMDVFETERVIFDGSSD